MGGTNQRMNLSNPQEYENHLRNTSQSIKNSPVEDRTCNDICCVITFIVILIAFIAIGVFFIVKADFKMIKTLSFSRTSGQQNPQDIGKLKAKLDQLGKVMKDMKSDQTNLKHVLSDEMAADKLNLEIKDYKIIIIFAITMTIFAIFLALMFIFLLSKFPKCMLYTMIIGSVVVLIVIIVLFCISKNYIPAIIVGIFLLIWGCMLCCLRRYIDRGIVILKIAGNFILQKPTVLLAPFFTAFFSFLFMIFWIASLVAVALYFDRKQDNSKRKIFFTLWAFFSTFFTIFLYYVLVFIIATSVALWYYKINQNYLFTAVIRIFKYHLGSLTFAAMIITIIKMIKDKANQEAGSTQNIVAKICMCLVVCCFAMLEELLRVLNHNAIIVMSVTGESYIESAKSTIGLIYRNFGLFVVVESIQGLVSFCGVLFVTIIPSVVGYYLIKATQQQPNPIEIMVGVFIIIVLTLLIGSLFFSVLSQVMNCIFIFFCLDQKFVQLGYPVSGTVPHQLRSLLDQMHQCNQSEGGINQGYSNPNQGYSNPNQGFQNPNPRSSNQNQNQSPYRGSNRPPSYNQDQGYPNTYNR